MSAKSYKAFILLSMSGFIALGLLVGSIFPKLPGWAYLAASLVGGATIMLVAKRMAARSKEVLSDERDQVIAQEAALLVYRLTYPLTMLAGSVIICLPGMSLTALTVGRVLICVAVFQALTYGIACMAKSAKH